MQRRHVFWTVVVLLLLIAAGVLVAVRWNAWFYNPPEQPYIVADSPHNLMLTLAEDGDSQRVLSWRCGKDVQHSFLTLESADGQTDTIAAFGKVVETRAGEAAFYHASLDCLQQGTWKVTAHTGETQSAVHTLLVAGDDMPQHEFVVLGDVQATEYDYSEQLFHSVFRHCPDAEFMVQAGDLIERPTDRYWQLFFSTFPSDTLIPFVAATGNHEYLKGLTKTLDSRWTSVFVNPQNGPLETPGRSYFVDYYGMRLIVIDTDGLIWLSDYTRTEAWLHKTLTDTAACRLWKTVVMHHPVRPAGMWRDNPIISAMFAKALKNADVVISGHDHNYSRRIINHRLGGRPRTLSYVVSSSMKYYLPRLNSRDDRLLSAHPHYLSIKYDSLSVDVATYMVEDNTLYDRVVLTRDTVYDYFAGVAEIIDVPDNYSGKRGIKSDIFRRRRAKRILR